MSDNIVTVTAIILRPRVPKSGTLEDRLRAAMCLARDPVYNYFTYTDDQRFRAAVAATAMDASAEEQDLITRSLLPIKMLSAAISGVPVDFGALGLTDDLLPLLGMWHGVVGEENEP